MTMRRRSAGGLVLASIFLVFLACDGSPTDPGDFEMGFETVLKGSLPGTSPDPEGQEVIRDGAAWQAVWLELHGGSLRPLPKVNFGSEMVIVILGPGCSGDTTISAIAHDGSGLVVHAATASCLQLATCSIADFSLHVVRVPRFEGSVRFNVKRGAGFC